MSVGFHFQCPIDTWGWSDHIRFEPCVHRQINSYCLLRETVLPSPGKDHQQQNSPLILFSKLDLGSSTPSPISHLHQMHPEVKTEELRFKPLDHWNITLLFIWNRAGHVITGGQDAVVNVFDLQNPRNDPDFCLIGHLDNICSLDVTAGGTIISGSWDKLSWIRCFYRSSFLTSFTSYCCLP